MDELYNYQETLDIVEKFMVESKIREYCETVCKGKCCRDCYDTKNACRKNEGRRLPCSAYICSSLQARIKSSIRDRWYKMAIEIEKTVASLLNGKYSDSYFSVNIPEIQEAFRIKKSLVDDLVLSESDIGVIRRKMENLINNETQIVRV